MMNHTELTILDGQFLIKYSIQNLNEPRDKRLDALWFCYWYADIMCGANIHLIPYFAPSS